MDIFTLAELSSHLRSRIRYIRAIVSIFNEPNEATFHKHVRPISVIQSGWISRIVK